MALQTDRQKVAHLLRRFGLGASEAEIEYYGKDGLKGAIELLLNYEQVEDAPPFPIEAMRNPQNNNLNIQAVQAWWIIRLITTKRPLEQKLTLFWHDHFATSAEKVTSAGIMYNQIETLRENAGIKFLDLLSAVSKDPAMLFWLDNQFNVKGKPNENFAREVMELFTVGIGNYTEKDIQEAARAFTGWTIARQSGRPVGNQNQIRGQVQFRFNRQLHDTGEKAILGSKGAFGGDEVLGILVGQPQTSMFITEKMWNWFAYPNPDKKVVERHAKKFRDSGHDVKALVRSIMEDSEFYSEKAERAVYKNPVDFCIVALRALGVGQYFQSQMLAEDGTVQRGRLGPAAVAGQAMKAMGMDLLYPPDVAGWEHGKSWISTATMVERISFADRVFTPTNTQSRRANLRYPAANLVAENPTPEFLVDTLLSVFDAPLPASKKPALVAAASKFGTRFNGTTANQAANAVTKLIFGSPEYQFN